MIVSNFYFSFFGEMYVSQVEDEKPLLKNTPIESGLYCDGYGIRSCPKWPMTSWRIIEIDSVDMAIPVTVIYRVCFIIHSDLTSLGS